LKYKTKLHYSHLLDILDLSGTVYGDFFVKLEEVGDIVSASKEYGTTFMNIGWDNVKNTSGAGRSDTSSLGKLRFSKTQYHLFLFR